MLAWTLISKGDGTEDAYLSQALKNIAPHVDRVFVTLTHRPGEKVSPTTNHIATSLGGLVSKFEWCDDFAAARNFNWSQVPDKYEVVGWSDTDDILDHPEKLREIASLMGKADAIFFEYFYEIDADGSVRTKHWRERLIRNNGAFTWQGRLHETLIETRRTLKLRNDEVKVIHTAKEERRDAAVERNIRILKAQLEEDSSTDPRTLFYLAACYKDLGDDASARDMYQMYLKLSGWDEERAQAHIQLARIARANGENTEARGHYLQAIAEKPDLPQGYVGLGEMYLLDEKFDRAIHWLEMALSKPEPEGMTVYNPLEYTYAPLLYFAEAKFQTGDFDTAIRSAEKAARFKNDEVVQDRLQAYKAAKTHSLVTDAIKGLATYLGDDTERLEALYHAVPESHADNPIALKLKKKIFPPVKWDKGSVVIFIGNSVLGQWGPWSLEEGIGGSEEAVIRLSKRLVEQGLSVTVYGTPADREGVYDGVQWLNYWQADFNDTYDVFVAWRAPWLFDHEIKARKKYLWLHDVVEPGEFTVQRLSNLDKVIVLSQYHRSLFPMVPDDKIFLSANGVDVDEFELADLVRNPYKIVYQSSHVRGLQKLYDMWPEIKAQVPQAELKVMYGWSSFKAVHADNPERMAWAEYMEKQARELDGVEEMGKVGQDEIARQILTAGLWVYPCPFPEISCITAMKCQVGGAIPISSDYAALNETVQHGVKIHIPNDEHGDALWNDTVQDKFKKAIVDLLRNPEKQDSIRAKMMPKAKKTFSWTKVAEGWANEFSD